MKPESVVVVKRAEGYVAHIRYADRSLDQDISAPTRYTLNYKIDKLFEVNS